MSKVTYTAPTDDALRVVYMGVAFEDGVAVEVDNSALLAKAQGNPWFTVGEAPRRGRPPKVVQVEQPVEEPAVVEAPAEQPQGE